ncbi:LOW QUALITY PROTEIN: alpha-2-macroglobulin-like [Ptychodera flava]|uniref:LOW QUALITY PROTEIN: alpha-2-macroglobulin-like n=1 Tax=Ptychodera flava TaxID=63121 RepID=UPI00396A4A5C
MHSVASFILLSLLAMQAFAERGYLISAPKAMIAGTVEKVCITLIEVTDDVLITISLTEETEQREVIAREEYVMDGHDECLDLKIPDRSLDNDYYTVKLNVSGHSLSVEDQFSFADGKRIYLQSRNAKTFIQTDKPIYKPGQTVLFRILNLKGTEFKPYPSMLSMVWIENPAGVRLMQWSNVTTEDGLVELELELSEEPVLGMWKIKSLMEGKTTEQTFEVAEYVLPKFEVVVNSPPFIIVTDKIISVEICSRYTYGQPVRGAVSASICISGYSYYGEDRPCALRLVEDTGPSGCAPFYVSSEELNLVSSNYSIWQANLKVTAEFTEANTGVTLSGERVGPSISTSPFQLEIQAPENFKPGVPYFGKVKVTNPDGSPADGKLVNLVVGTNDGDILDKNFTSVNGAFDFTLKNLAIDTSRMNIRATGPGFTEPYDYRLHRYVYRVYNPHASKSIKPWYSPSGSFVQIEPVKQTLPVDSEYSFTVFYTTQDIQLVDLYIKMVSHGDIVHTDRKLIELLPEIERQHLTTTKRPSTASPTRAPEEEYGSEDIPVLEEVLIDEYWPWWPEPVDPSVEIAEPGAYGEVTLTLQIDRQMAPNCKLLLYYIRGDGEVIADSIKFKVQRKFENEVKLQFAEDETLPGANTQLELTAAPGSLCAIGVVDKSVHLMKTGNQLTKAKVFKTLDEYDLSNTYGYVDESTHCDDDDLYHPWLRRADFRKKRSIAPWWYGGGYSRYDDALTAFKNVDMVVMTDVLLETRPCEERRYPVMMSYYRAGGAAPGPEAIPEAQEMDIAEADERVAFIETEVGEDENFSPLVEIRTYFPETWLWKLQRVGKSGNSVTEVEVPHTITEWIGSGFCTSSEKGVGVSETAKLTAFQPFFLSYTLPYSVIRGEKVPILVTVFNYLSQCLTVELRISLSDDFESLEDSPVKRVCVCGSESTTVSYRIVPNTLGEIPITVLGESVNGAELCGNEAVMSDRVGARDALSENLLVEPEGIEEEYTVSSFFCPQDETDDVYESRIRLEVPDNVIDGSARATLSVIGDIMGPTLSGLDRLLTVPYGCGEQNMVSFTPNIFVLQYLTQTDQVTAEIEEKALANMRKGYQRELTYRHGDGSYSAFGERDPEGSTWLTAFVVKSFAQSDKYITIDEKDLAVSINWFKKQQNPETGCFIKRGSVHNKRLKGGVSDETSLQRLLIAMLEAGIPAEDISVQAALSCLEGKVDNITAPYTTAIVSYAFALANSDRKAYMLEKLDSIAIRSEGSVYWGEEEKQEEEDDDRPLWWRWYHQSSSSNVEMTSYALLAQLVDVEVDGDVIGRVLPTVRWLTKQRNAYGGFSSTQDTVLALQALAAYAGQIYQDGIDMYVDFLSTDMVERFEVNHLNKLVLQRTEVPVLPDTVFVEAGGVGCALMQASVKYNVPESPAPPSFDVSVLVSSTELVLADDVGEETEPNCSGDRRVEICARYMGEDDSSNMAVIEVKMVSGYYPNKDDLRFASKIVDQMARFDVDKNKVIFYFDEISHETMCFTFGIEHLIKVEDAKPGWVSIYDYYDKDTSAIETYDTCVERLSLNIEVEEPDACPKCLNSMPANFGELLCGKEVFKAKNHGSNGEIKVMENFSFNFEREEWGEEIKRIIKPVIPDGCTCELLDADAETEEKMLVVADTAQIMISPDEKK